MDESCIISMTLPSVPSIEPNAFTIAIGCFYSVLCDP